ncbi:MAG: insulinase family protein [Paludibacteraceae bacterium]|nr:insulinase family protein [Paludibacteraceae bacterium]
MLKSDYKLPSGIRLLHVRAAGDVSYCGAIINTGTRDERFEESGYAHLVEHLMFKGTSKYTSRQIISRIEDIGGEINAYTTKEDTTVYAAFLKRHLERVFSLIANMVLDSTFNQKSIDKEVDVILDEIDSYIDNPAEIILDDFEDLIFSGNPLGRNILGDRKTLKSVTQEKILNFYRRTYTPDQILFFIMGNYTKERVLNMAEKVLASVPVGKRDYEREPLKEYSPVIKKLHKKTKQTHLVLGNRCYSLYAEERFSFALLNNILGGDFMSSILNMKLREKEGLVYEVDSNYTAYFETGNWNIYFGCDDTDTEKVLKIVKDELQKLSDKPISAHELKLAKRRLLSYLTICGENKESWILGTAKQFLNTGKIMDTKEVEEKINAVTATDIQRCAKEVFNPEKLTILQYC